MHAQIFQHVSFEGPGHIKTWLENKHARISTTRFYADEYPPDIEDVDLLILMGGPMSVNDTDRYPWLELEKAFIHAAIHAGKPVLGICLGAQLIASAMGSRIYPAPTKEIGWFPIVGNPASPLFRFSEAERQLGQAEELTVLHWHGETFDIPPDATLLASTPECKNQAFLLNGKKVIGLQFHLETTPDSLDSLIEHCRDEIGNGPKRMSEEEMKRQSPAQYLSIHHEMERILDFLIS